MDYRLFFFVFWNSLVILAASRRYADEDYRL